MSKTPGKYEKQARGWCSAHGKLLYRSRKSAKASIREHHEHMRPYPCTEIAGQWHIGHLPAAVHYGVATAGEIYGGAA